MEAMQGGGREALGGAELRPVAAGRAARRRRCAAGRERGAHAARGPRPVRGLLPLPPRRGRRGHLRRRAPGDRQRRRTCASTSCSRSARTRWAKLDRFEGRIPRLFAQLRPRRAPGPDGGAARRSSGPVESGTAGCRRGEQPYTVEPALVDAVLDAAAAGGSRSPRAAPRGDPRRRVERRGDRGAVPPARHGAALARDGRGGRARPDPRPARGARRARSRSSRTTCSKRSARSPPPSRPSPPTLFRFLVTRSKTKIAHPASDLADWTERPEPEVAAVLEKLCRGESGRILRPVRRPRARPGDDALRALPRRPRRADPRLAARLRGRTGPGARRTGSSPVSEACWSRSSPSSPRSASGR